MSCTKWQPLVLRTTCFAPLLIRSGNKTRYKFNFLETVNRNQRYQLSTKTSCLQNQCLPLCVCLQLFYRLPETCIQVMLFTCQTTLDKKKKEPCCWCINQNLVILRNQGTRFSCGTASICDLRFHASMYRGEIKLQILQYHTVHYHDGSFFFVEGSITLPILCMRCARWERERERERERETEVTSPLVALKVAMSFALFFAKNVHLSIGEEFCTFLCQIFAP